jgi:cell division septation protein DedD
MASGNTKKFEMKLGKAGLIIVIVGMTALICATFLFGVSVGKNIDTYPEKISSFPQRILALFWRPARIKVFQTTADNKTAQTQPKGQDELDLTFYNTLTSKKGVAKEQAIPEKKNIMEAPPPAAAAQQKSEENDVAAETKMEPPKTNKAKTEKTPDAIEAKIKEVAPAKVPAGTKFSVQVASLKEKTKAAQMSKKITGLGFAPQIVETDVPGKGKWFRVIVYGFVSKPQAQAAAKKIAEKTGKRCIVRHLDAIATKN